MEISLRSQLAAGIAVAGAAAIAVTPVIHPEALPSLERVSANIQIATWADPLAVLGDSLGVLGESLFDASPGALFPIEQPFDGTFSVLAPLGLLPQLLNGSSIRLTANPGTRAGAVSGVPLLSAVGTNFSKYAAAGINSLGAISDATGALVFGLPFVAFEVLDDVINGQPFDILQIIEDTIINPLTNAFETVVEQTAYVIESLIGNVVALVSAVPALVTGVFEQVLASTVLLGTQALNTVVDSVTSLASLDLEQAWNAAVNGLLGPNGVLGKAIRLSLGNGVITGDPQDPFIPSLKQVLTVGTVSTSLLIAADVPPPPAAALKAAAAQSAVPAAVAEAESSDPAEIKVAEVVDAPAAEVPAVAEAPQAPVAPVVTAGDDHGAEKASTPKRSHRVGKKG